MRCELDISITIIIDTHEYRCILRNAGKCDVIKILLKKGL